MSLRCSFGFHQMAVRDWNAVYGETICSRCGRVEEMRGAVLAEWIRYRTKRDLEAGYRNGAW